MRTFKIIRNQPVLLFLPWTGLRLVKLLSRLIFFLSRDFSGFFAGSCGTPGLFTRADVHSEKS
jgi:hypothetical protein